MMKQGPERVVDAPTSWPAWWAAIANLKPGDGVPVETAAQLGAAYRTLAVPPWWRKFKALPRGDWEVAPEMTSVAWEREPTPEDFAEAVLPEARQLAETVLLPLLRNQQPVLVPTPWRGVAFMIDGAGVAHEIEPVRESGSEVPFALYQLFKSGRPFPLRACPQCGKVFQRAGARRFCEPLCQSRHREATRVIDNERLAQLADASRAYRERKKAERERQERAERKAAARQRSRKGGE